MHNKPAPQKIFWPILLVSAIFLSIATTYAQVDDVTFRFIRIQQEKAHQEMMEGVAGNPWQYRILADWMIDPLMNLFVARDVLNPKPSAFIFFRFLQCLLIFIAAGVYYKKLGLSLVVNLLGLSMLAWSMSLSLYNSDLSFNVFFDIAFYLIAAILIIGGRFFWIPVLMIPAALNRETSLLIPFMLLSFVYFGDENAKNMRLAILFTAVSLIVFLIVFVGLRNYYGEQTFLTADGYYPGIGLLVLNLSRIVTWQQLSVTLGIIPFLTIFSYRSWHRTLKIFFWVVVPIWFIVHLFAALVAETRLLLVPQALIFIPGALFGIVAAAGSEQKILHIPD